jgi:plasmid stabilization system protein ParE
MSRRFIVRRQAESDIAAAARWYEEQRPGLSLRFRSAIDEVFSTIERDPERFAPIYRDLRRALLRRFPYGILYVVRSQTTVVVGVLHTSRNPKLWRTRLKN